MKARSKSIEAVKDDYPEAFYQREKKLFVARLIIRKGGMRMEDRKMTSKSKVWSFIFILISGAIFLSPAIVNAEYVYKKGEEVEGSDRNIQQRIK